MIIAMPQHPRRCIRKMVSNIREIQACPPLSSSGGENDTAARAVADHFIAIPAVPTLLQPLVSTGAVAGVCRDRRPGPYYDVDKPRNLAKSVTVE